MFLLWLCGQTLIFSKFLDLLSKTYFFSKFYFRPGIWFQWSWGLKHKNEENLIKTKSSKQKQILITCLNSFASFVRSGHLFGNSIKCPRMLRNPTSTTSAPCDNVGTVLALAKDEKQNLMNISDFGLNNMILGWLEWFSWSNIMFLLWSWGNKIFFEKTIFYFWPGIWFQWSRGLKTTKIKNNDGKHIQKN